MSPDHCPLCGRFLEGPTARIDNFRTHLECVYPGAMIDLLTRIVHALDKPGVSASLALDVRARMAATSQITVESFVDPDAFMRRGDLPGQETIDFSKGWSSGPLPPDRQARFSNEAGETP